MATGSGRDLAVTIVAGVLAVAVPSVVGFVLTQGVTMGGRPAAGYFAMAAVLSVLSIAAVFLYGLFAPATNIWVPAGVAAGAALVTDATTSILTFSRFSGGGAFQGFLLATMMFGLVWSVAFTGGVALGGAAIRRHRLRKRQERGAVPAPPMLPSFERMK